MEGLHEYLSIAPFSWFEVACVVASGMLIGLERQMLGKPAGMRTSALIALSTYLFVAVGRAIGPDYTRVVAQVVTGVGFLGGGVILSKEGVVKGLTSAAAIWVLSAIGATIGSGHPVPGLKIAVIAITILLILDVLEKRFKSLQKGEYRIKKK